MKARRTGFFIMTAILILGLSACESEQTTVTEEKPLQTAVECDKACLDSPASGLFFDQTTRKCTQI